MVTIRTRSLMWFVAGLTLALAMLWTSTVWRAEALPGPEESTIVPVNPQERVLDSRDPVDLGLPGPFASQVPQKLQITGSIPTATGTKTVVPAGATGVLLNVTGFNPSANGFISIRPGDATGAPTTSSINILAGQTVPNAVQVSLPTSGPNAGQIDITYDALGVVGPTTDMFIDVVGYTTNTGLQDINTQLGDRYTKAESEARYVNHGDIEMGYMPHFEPNHNVPADIRLFSNLVRFEGGTGTGHLTLPGPNVIDGMQYGLKSVTYCLEDVVAPAIVTTARVHSYGPLPSDFSAASDLTDRDSPGCYTVTVNNKTATSHMLTLGTAGGAGELDFRSVTAIWSLDSSLPKVETSGSDGDGGADLADG